MLTVAEVARLNVWAMQPEMLAKVTELMATVERELGLKTYVRKYGGWRGPGVQAELVAWRNEADMADGIVGGGRDFYAVAPAGSSHHEWGAAVDLQIVDPAKRTASNYKAVADISRRIGLRAGFYFAKRDEFHHELRIPLAEARERWRSAMRSRATVIAALAAIAVLLVAVFVRQSHA